MRGGLATVGGDCGSVVHVKQRRGRREEGDDR
jgi:hypothetical protein